jgi:hypothetical protein
VHVGVVQDVDHLAGDRVLVSGTGTPPRCLRDAMDQ